MLEIIYITNNAAMNICVHFFCVNIFFFHFFSRATIAWQETPRSDSDTADILSNSKLVSKVTPSFYSQEDSDFWHFPSELVFTVFHFCFCLFVWDILVLSTVNTVSHCEFDLNSFYSSSSHQWSWWYFHTLLCSLCKSVLWRNVHSNNSAFNLTHHLLLIACEEKLSLWSPSSPN